MGLTLTAKYNGAPSYDMSAGSFYRLRCDIAYTVSNEYGDHYKGILMACAGYDTDAYNKKTEILIKKHHCKERFLDFLYQSDIEGKLSPFKCKAILDQIKDLENNSLYGYTAYPEHCITIQKFKDLLRECFEKRVYMVWY